MNDKCDAYKEMIPRALLGDLEAGRSQELEQHLAECADCRAEREEYLQTMEQFSAIEDVPVPRHFFVPADARNTTFRELLQALAWPWKLAAAGAVAVLLLLVGLGLSAFQFRAESGVYAFSFGRPIPEWNEPAKTGEAISALRTELRAFVEQTVQAERRQYLAALKTELDRSGRRLTAEQRSFLQAALSDVETRMNDRVVAATAAVETRTAGSLDSLYANLQAQRTQDLSFLRRSIAQTARMSEAHDRQTQEVLSTLLEVADLQIQRTIN